MFENMILISILVSFIIMLLIASDKIFNIKYSAKYRYIIWIIIAVRLIIPFQLDVQNSVVVELPIQNFTAYQDNYSNEALKYDNLAKEQNLNFKNNKQISLKESLELIWSFGFAMFLIFHIFSYSKFKKNVNRWSRLLDIEFDIPVYICPKIDTPMLVGLFKPKILIPRQTYSKLEIDTVLEHERVHFIRKDLWIKVIFIIANAVHWFNPIVYIMVNRANWDMELSCDDKVILDKNLDFKKAYSNIILHFASSNKINALTTQFSGGKKDMKKRLENIFDKNIKKSGLLLVTIISVTLMGSSLVGCSTSSNEANMEIEGMPKTVKGILAETEKNAELENLIKDTFQIPEEYLADTKYYYNNIDLNDDGNDEIIAVAIGMYTSGTGGDSAIIASKKGDKLEVIQSLSLVHEPIIVSDDMTNGYKDIIVPNYGGGADAKEPYKVLKNTDGKYSDINDSDGISDISNISGTAIIANDIVKDIQESKALSLEP